MMLPPLLLQAVVEITVYDKERQWVALKTFLGKWWFNLDYQGLEVILSTFVSHFCFKEAPVWLLVVGTSGTGKSAIALRSLEVLDHVLPISDITPSTFLSGFEASGGGLLQILNKHHGGNGVFTISDLSVITGKRPEMVSEVIAQLRKIYDGSHSKYVGNQEKPLEWEGKVTMVAAGTEQVEKHWAVYRNLGERFVHLRWRQRGDDEAEDMMNECAAKQVGNEEMLKTTFRKLIREFVDSDTLTPVAVDKLGSLILKLNPITKIVTTLRAPVIRERTGSKRNVISVGDKEGSGRIIKVLANIARGSATLFRRDRVTGKDLKLAYRVAVDSVPRDRLKLVAYLAAREKTVENNRVSCREVARKLGIPKTSFYRLVEDLCYLKAVQVCKINDEMQLELTSRLRTLIEKSVSCLSD